MYGCDASYTADERPDTAQEDDCRDSDDGEYDETGDLTTTLVIDNHADANLG